MTTKLKPVIFIKGRIWLYYAKHYATNNVIKGAQDHSRSQKA